MGDVVDLWTTLGAAPLRRDVVRVHGAEAVEFLQGQLSQDVAALPVGSSAPTLLLHPTGKVVAWLRATRVADDEILLDVDAGCGEVVVERLVRFRLRTKAELELGSWSGFAVRGPGAHSVHVPSGSMALPAGWPGVEGVDLLSDGEVALAGVSLVHQGSLEALRVECGVPAMGAELTDATIPAEAGQWLIEASVSFTKGCYTGQELVARIDSRGGNVPRPVRGLLVDGEAAAVGATVHLDADEVGVVTSAAHSATLGAVALAPLARAVAPAAQVELRDLDGDATVATVTVLPMR